MAIAADRRARLRQSALGADYARPPDHRLTDRLRHGIDAALTETVAEVERALRLRAQRMLAADGHDALAATLAPVPDRRDCSALVAAIPELPVQLAGRAALAARAAAMPIHGADDPDEPGFLAALAQSEDRRIAAAARMLMLADPLDGSAGRPSSPHRAAIGWWLAGAIERERGGIAPADRLTLRCALVASAQALAEADDAAGDPVAAADQLVQAIDPRPGEVPFLLIEAARDRRLALFCAILGRATGIVAERILPMLASPNDDRLWPALRAAGLDRTAMAMILSVLTSGMEPGSALVRADALSDAAAMPVDMAAALVLPLRCPDGYALALTLPGPGEAWG
jgi:hypothetical protein